MKMAFSLGIAVKRLAAKVLALDDTALPAEQVRFIGQLFSRREQETRTKDLNKMLKAMKKKHIVDGIIVSKLDGSLLGSTTGNGSHDALIGTALFNYVRSELPNSKVILIKQDGWHMLFHYADRIYIVKADNHLAGVELRALAREVEKFIEEHEIPIA